MPDDDACCQHGAACTAALLRMGVMACNRMRAQKDEGADVIALLLPIAVAAILYRMLQPQLGCVGVPFGGWAEAHRYPFHPTKQGTCCWKQSTLRALFCQTQFSSVQHRHPHVEPSASLMSAGTAT